MEKPSKIAPAKGKLGVLLPGMGAVSTTFMAGVELVRRGKDLISDITRARVPMPKSTREYVEECERYRRSCTVATREVVVGLELSSSVSTN